MKRLGMAALLTAVLVSGVAAQAPMEFKSVAGKFSVKLPGTPEETKQTSQGVDIFMYTLKKDPLFYIVGYGDYPQATIDQRGPEAMLDADRDSFVKAVKGKILSEKKVKLDGNPGRDIMIEGASANFQLREYLVGRRLYQIVSGGAKEAINSPANKSFHESFKLVK
jgi:hypothetical protein